MRERIAESLEQLAASWMDMGQGAPTIIALAQLCGRGWAQGRATVEELSLEARVILFAAAHRGMLEIRGTNTAYESASRLLTVHVERDAEDRVQFRAPGNIEQNVRFLDGFRQLCAQGYVMHHLYHEFTLTPAGFALAKAIQLEEIEPLLAFQQECGRD